MPAARTYHAVWFDPRSGRWLDADSVTVGNDGQLRLPPLPDGKPISENDWGLRLCRRKATTERERENE